MPRTEPPFQQAYRKVRAALEAEEGTLWREVRGAVHSQYDEIPFWILLYEDSDLGTCHRRFAAIAIPWMDVAAPLEFTVSYTILKGWSDTQLDMADGNAEIVAAVGNPAFGARSETGGRRRTSVFTAAESGRRPA
ncbi:hypothetical protein [Jannaschia sp. LMIT008]|uniref:hypothetical protein n=1 Tax=Jannaschia maritima TaxID=3032585 RepID=UPI002810CC25|nr:hypothetical protein [Jannaschia sp. LMIT008]